MVRQKNTKKTYVTRSSSSSQVLNITKKKKKTETRPAMLLGVMTKVMLKSMRRLQLSTKFIIPKLPFSRLVREIIMELYPNRDSLRIQLDALKSLQESCELYITQFFEDSYLYTLHANRKNLMMKDVQLARSNAYRYENIYYKSTNCYSKVNV